ncbi:hypothetical protein FACS1894156_0790 [Bacteroidia bacterium]|nr:hypothetical protein FACS1894156_0790 [Bacteroidia bacterium]
MPTATYTRPHFPVADGYMQTLSGLDTGSKIEVIQYLLNTIYPLSSVTNRPIGILAGKASFTEVGDGKITESEFLGL